MTSLKEFYKKSLALEKAFPDIQDKVLNDSADKYAEANAKQQFNTGKKSDGSTIGKYSTTTINIKQRKKQPTDRMTLEDTKSFHSGFFGKLENGNIKISSTDIKTRMLVSRYGSDIFGLMQNYRYQVSRKVVLPIYLKEIKKKLKLKP